MKAEDLYEAIGDISDELLEESEHIEKTERRAKILLFPRLAAAAACLLIIGGGVYGISHMRMGSANQAASTMAVAEAVAEEASGAPAVEAPAAVSSSAAESSKKRADMLDKMEGYGIMTQLLRPDNNAVLLPDDGSNHALSPVNIAMALSLLSEMTEGETQQQILSVLGVSSVEELRETAAKLLTQTGYKDENGTALIANSVWLRDDFGTYNADTLKKLKDTYAADAFTGEMGSAAYNGELRKWLDENTGKLLTQQAQGVSMDPETQVALASTIFYKANWVNPFEEALTQDRIFHAPSGDRNVPTMSTYEFGRYYRGEHFGAARLPLTDGNAFWFLLPDEGYSVGDVTSDPAMMRILQDPDGTDSTQAMIRLQFPKFDIVSDADIVGALQAMGISDVFDPDKADFTPLLADTPAAVSSIEHAARVAVDEYGVTAAAFTVVLCEGAAEIDGDEVNMICDRPFVFALTNEDGSIFFEGIVAEP